MKLKRRKGHVIQPKRTEGDREGIFKLVFDDSNSRTALVPRE